MQYLYLFKIEYVEFSMVTNENVIVLVSQICKLCSYFNDECNYHFGFNFSGLKIAFKLKINSF